jgi:hypothetical protein
MAQIGLKLVPEVSLNNLRVDRGLSRLSIFFVRSFKTRQRASTNQTRRESFSNKMVVEVWDSFGILLV